MKMSEIAVKLGLAATATESEIESALDKVKTNKVNLGVHQAPNETVLPASGIVIVPMEKKLWQAFRQNQFGTWVPFSAQSEDLSKIEIELRKKTGWDINSCNEAVQGHGLNPTAFPWGSRVVIPAISGMWVGLQREPNGKWKVCTQTSTDIKAVGVELMGLANEISKVVEGYLTQGLSWDDAFGQARLKRPELFRSRGAKK
jgi:hypothetical protein